MEKQTTQPTIPVQESSATSASNIPPAPPPHVARKFKIILIGFLIIFFLTIGTAAAVYTFKEVTRSNNNELEQTPSVTPLPSTEFEISPLPTSSSSGECVVGGCSGQLCVPKGQEENAITTCEWTEAYACYRTATCETQKNGTCGWTQTPELTSCLESAQ